MNDSQNKTVINLIIVLFRMKAKDEPPEEREKIVHEVVTEQISPALLAEKYGIGVAQIRAWVKNAGHKLPSRYKATKMKEIKPT